MAMESSILRNDAVDLTLFFWGGKCAYYDFFSENRLRQRIVMACYYDRLTEGQLCSRLGVPAAYLADPLQKLLTYDLLRKNGLTYQSNIVIITGKELEAVNRLHTADLEKTAGGIRVFADEYMDEMRALGFRGCDMPANSLRWMLVSLILRRAYIDLLQSSIVPDCPADGCIRFLMELPKNDPYYTGISASGSKDGTIFLWDVPVNGEELHPLISPVRADMLISLPEAQPAADSEKSVCSELMELGLARKEGERILPAFPCLNKDQSAILESRILPVAQSICSCAVSRIDGVSRIMKEHAPEHLADYAGRLPVFLQLKEAETIMRLLCENGWLLPMKNCLATTVMIRNK